MLRLKDVKPWIVHICITVVSLSVALSHVLCPELAVDNTVIALLVLAAVPWLGQILRSVKVPGVLEAEFRERVAEAESKAIRSGLLEAPVARVPVGVPATGERRMLTARALAEADPNLALAALRMQVEERLRSLAEHKGIRFDVPLTRLLDSLSSQEALTPAESGAIRDLIGVLNQAVHGAVISPSTSAWALDVGEGILNSLERRIS